MASLRVISGDGAGAVPDAFKTAARAAFEGLLATDGVNTMMIIVGTPEEAHWVSVPSNPSLERGFVRDIAVEIIPDMLK